MDNSLLECINIAQNTLGENLASSAAKPRTMRSHYPRPDDLIGQIDRVDKSLLECINLAERMLNAKKHDAPEAKFNKDFDNFMSGLDNTDPLDSKPI